MKLKERLSKERKDVLFNSEDPTGYRKKGQHIFCIIFGAVTDHMCKYKFHTNDPQKTHK